LTEIQIRKDYNYKAIKSPNYLLTGVSVITGICVSFYIYIGLILAIFNTPPQGGAYMPYVLSLLQILPILNPRCDFVRTSASWSFELRKLIAMHPNSIFYQMKLHSTSICFTNSWNTRFNAICNAAWLSQINFISSSTPIFNSYRSCLSYISSQVANAIARYFAYALGLATTSCLLLFQDIRLPPIKMQ